MVREKARVASAWVVSVVGHLTVFGLSGLLLAHSLRPKPLPPPPVERPAIADTDTVEIDLPKVSGSSLYGDPGDRPADDPVAIARGGGEGTPRLDSGHAGRGGTDGASTPALNLADRDDKTTLSPDVQSRFDRSQIQRIDSGKDRASREDYRASREPMELTFLAMGRSNDSDRPEHRKPSDVDPSAGSRGAGLARREGSATLGADGMPEGFGELPRDPGGAVLGGDRTSAGGGVRDGAPGMDHRDSARVANARPMVETGTPSVPADKQGHPSDTQDSEQEVAAKMQSFIHASTAGGAPGSGPGGQAGPGAPGAGGVNGAGSKAKALGTGAGTGVDDDPKDRRRTEYMRQVLAKVYPLWNFPKWAALEGMQGMVIVTVTIRADGSIGAPQVTRPSGIPEFDETCRSALVRAAPFPALPPELGTSFRWAMRFDSPNPAVRPKSSTRKE